MNLKALARSVMRYFRPAATSVSPQIDPDAACAEILKALRASGMIPADAEVRVHHGPLPAAGVQAPRPGLKPPPDPAAEGWSWAAWKRELDAVAMPGWAVCRFANRIGPDNAAFVFGIVRGSFGIWRQPFNVCAAGTDSTEHILTCVTHLRSGLGVGIFADREVAVAAAEIADRVCPAWETLDPDDRMKWNEVHARTGAAWSGIGVRHSEDSHCHDAAGGTYAIYTRSPESVMAGRPEKLS